MEEGSSATTVKATGIDFADFTEAVTGAVFRAAEARADKKKGGLQGTVTVGFIYEENKQGIKGLIEERIPPGIRSVLEPAELGLLRTRQQINRESVGKVTDLLQRDYRRYGIKFANSLGQDFGRTMDTLFELTTEERNTVYNLTEESQDSLQTLSNILVEALNMNADLQLDLDISPSLTAAAEKKDDKKKGIDWEIKIETKCETDKNCSAGASLTIKF